MPIVSGEPPLTPSEVAARNRARVEREARKRALREQELASRMARSSSEFPPDRAIHIDESPSESNNDEQATLWESQDAVADRNEPV